jgi:putative addiction module component (TIGR02574 family)
MASELYESLDPKFAYDAAWSEEIKRRVDKLKAVTVKTIPWEQFRRKMLNQQGD